MPRKFGPREQLFTYTSKYPQYACKPSFMAPYWEYGPKPPKFQIFTHFCNQKRIKKIRSTKIEILIALVLVSLVVHIQTKYQKDRMKTEGAYSIWKKKYWLQTARHRIGSADSVRSGAKKITRSLDSNFEGSVKFSLIYSFGYSSWTIFAWKFVGPHTRSWRFRGASRSRQHFNIIITMTS